MGRVSASEVKDIIDTDLTDSVIDTYILYAHTLVEDHLVDEGLSDEALKEIERYLTAHAITATTNREAIEEEAGPARQKFSDVFGPGFFSTSYGQMAMNIDDSGILADLGQAKQRPTIKAVKEELDFRYINPADTSRLYGD